MTTPKTKATSPNRTSEPLSGHSEAPSRALLPRRGPDASACAARKFQDRQSVAAPGMEPSPFRRCSSLARRPVLTLLMLLAGQGGMLATAPSLAQTVELQAAASPASAPQTAPTSGAVTAEGVNINSAGIEELARALNGVGRSRAEAIVRYREEFGPFESIEELSEVSGIGASTLERNRELLRLQ